MPARRRRLDLSVMKARETGARRCNSHAPPPKTSRRPYQYTQGLPHMSPCLSPSAAISITLQQLLRLEVASLLLLTGPCASQRVAAKGQNLSSSAAAAFSLPYHSFHPAVPSPIMTLSIKSHSGDSDKVMTPSDASAPAFFLQLPRELANRIISLACRAPGPSIPAYENVSFRSPLALDVETTLNLAQVSRAINEVVVGILYYAIRLTRPSALLELLHAVSLRPELGRLIKNLHIGAEETLVNDSDWPLEMQDTENGEGLEYPTLRLKTSLWHPDDDDDDILSATLPGWCQSQQSWPLEPGRLDCAGSAVMAAINAALDAIDVEPYRRGFARSEERIGLVSGSEGPANGAATPSLTSSATSPSVLLLAAASRRPV